MSNICIYMMRSSIKEVLDALLKDTHSGDFIGLGEVRYGDDKVDYPHAIQFTLWKGQVTKLCVGTSTYLETDDEDKKVPYDVLSVLQDLKTGDLHVEIGKKMADGDTLDYHTLIIREYTRYVGR